MRGGEKKENTKSYKPRSGKVHNKYIDSFNQKWGKIRIWKWCDRISK